MTLLLLVQKRLKTFEDVADQLGDLGIGMTWANQQKKEIKLVKRYLKSNFKVPKIIF